jgi:signal transduction histidine kinase
VGLLAFVPGLPVDVSLFVFVIVAGLMAGAAGTLAEHLPAYVAFTLPISVAAAGVAATSDHALVRLLAPLVLLYLVSITRVAHAGDRRSRASLELGFRNEGLVADLSVAQAHLTALNAGLERRVAERSEQLARVERQLGQAALLASVGGLAASVAHEINNPIASVLGNLGYLEEELAIDRPDLPACRDALSDARRGADRVRQTVRSLSAVARADHGGESVDLQAVLEACTSVVAGEVRRRAVLSREYGQVPPVRGDTPGLAQVFIQLLLQTAWAIPEGAPAGRALLVRTAWDQARDRVVVEIAGPAGASPSADDAASDEMGLKLAGEVVARLGGQLEARQVAGAGPGFSVALVPARPAVPAAHC